VLALNQADGGTARAANLYQFALAPEDEAAQAADRAWADGHRTAAAITPMGAWGDRVHASFRARWEALGGQVSAHQVYDAAPNDLGGAVAAVMGADAGQQRHEELEQILGRRLEYAPSASAEARCVFVAGTATKVRELRRELRKYATDGLMAYGTSSAWTGDASPDTEAGLAPIRIPDMPWLVADEGQGPVGRATLAAAIPASARSPLRRLYPMGIDSLDLLPHLQRLRTPGASFDGQTGNLTLDSQRRFHRRLVWIELGSHGMRVLGYDRPGTAQPAPVR
jgi:outer membrane PBP1 activator LpoA protein